MRKLTTLALLVAASPLATLAVVVLTMSSPAEPPAQQPTSSLQPLTAQLDVLSAALDRRLTEPSAPR
jgi:DNA-binding MurR/RpiR family transcriptional regulator